MYPGPVKFPCTVCSNPVRSNQQGICCNMRDKWTHASCSHINKDDVQRLQTNDAMEWYCPSCTLAELPLAGATDSLSLGISSTTTHNSQGALSTTNSTQLDKSDISQVSIPRTDKLTCRSLNARSIMNNRQHLQALHLGWILL